MTLPHWPADLPFRPLAGTLTMRLDEPLASFQPDVGEPIVRPRYTAGLRRWRGTLSLTGAEREQLLAFHRYDCLRGSRPFLLPDWRYLTHGTPDLAEFRWESRTPPEAAHQVGLLYHVTINIVSEDL